ncbi:MAG: hypothetical protein FJ125_05195 [Deltaproteobacteria bacterium]|nr:hypothetical protein [Deltaproteobacteria bacterium]
MEVCDGLDNDCDGVVDDEPVDEGGGCGSVQGECRAGLLLCSAGRLVCAGGREPGTELCIGPSDERCDGLDNDCDGSTDEGDPGGGLSCGSQVGACQPGRTSCQAGQLLCLGTREPASERCDGLDNDCDGRTDEDWPAPGSPCDSDADADACRGGSFRCDAAGGQAVCQGDVPRLQEQQNVLPRNPRSSEKSRSPLLEPAA